ncbi:hypothetical protein [Rhodopirellula sallentina]|uniref:Uncharacterized protein n=1 Tax=Rhodopirellula sallentina SM41 TaxID=1263870 RepID=M5U7W4_9BACT|nr:hypothetical protein [Rhodopirellula sallentina]EMI57364.1 hypothetical protein RSSM_01205 [Rhodopirellula sallentina SM41]
MRKRVPVVIGGGIALLIASQYFDFGLGFTDGDGNNDPQGQVSMDPGSSSPIMSIESLTPSDAPTAGDTSDDSDEAMREAASELELTPVIPVLPSVVDVLIDGNQYLVQTEAEQPDRKAISIEDIIAFAGTVEGEPSGILVRVARTPNAVAAADAALMKRLREAGLDDDQIDARRQLVELP